MAFTEGGSCVVPTCKWSCYATFSVRARFKQHYLAHMEVDQAPEAARALCQIHAVEALEDRVEYPTWGQIRAAKEECR